MYSIGSRSIIIEYVNAFLNNSDDGDLFTAETSRLLKNFQGAYNNSRTPITSDVNNIKNKPFLCANGVLDSDTLIAITGIEIEKLNTTKVKQVQEILHNIINPAIKPSGLYDAITMETIQGIKLNLDVYQEIIPIIKHNNLFPNLLSFQESAGNVFQWHCDNPLKDSQITGGLDVELSTTYAYTDVIQLPLTDETHVYNVKVFTDDYEVGYTTYVPNETTIVEPTNYGKTLTIEGSGDQESIGIRLFVHKTQLDAFDIADITDKIHVQMQGGEIDTYEPRFLTNSNKYCSPYVNKRLYEKLKSVYGLVEVLEP